MERYYPSVRAVQGITPSYAPLETDLERRVSNRIELPMPGLARGGPHTYRLDVYNKGRRRIMARDLGTTVPSKVRLSYDDVVTILEQQEMSDERCWFVLDYELTANGGRDDSVVSKGPLTVQTGCNPLTWTHYDASPNPRYQVPGHYEAGESRALPYTAGKTYDKGTVVEGGGGKKYIAVCDSPGALPSGGAPGASGVAGGP